MSEASMTVTELVDHSFCARRTYWRRVVSAPRRRTRKMQMGTSYHRAEREDWCARLEIDGFVSRRVPLVSEQFRGVADIVVYGDDTLHVVESKFSLHLEARTHVLQVSTYAAILQASAQEAVHAWLWYPRLDRLVEVRWRDWQGEIAKVVAEIQEIEATGVFPRQAEARFCEECELRRFCGEV